MVRGSVVERARKIGRQREIGLLWHGKFLNESAEMTGQRLVRVLFELGEFCGNQRELEAPERTAYADRVPFPEPNSILPWNHLQPRPQSRLLLTSVFLLFQLLILVHILVVGAVVFEQ